MKSSEIQVLNKRQCKGPTLSQCEKSMSFPKIQHWLKLLCPETLGSFDYAFLHPSSPITWRSFPLCHNQSIFSFFNCTSRRAAGSWALEDLRVRKFRFILHRGLFSKNAAPPQVGCFSQSSCSSAVHVDKSVTGGDTMFLQRASV